MLFSDLFIYDFLFWKNAVNVPSKNKRQFIVSVLKVNDEKGRIRSWIWSGTLVTLFTRTQLRTDLR
jgi:hypothetical protein